MSRLKIAIFGQECGRGRPRPYFSHGPNWLKIYQNVAHTILGIFPENYNDWIKTAVTASHTLFECLNISQPHFLILKHVSRPLCSFDPPDFFRIFLISHELHPDEFSANLDHRKKYGRGRPRPHIWPKMSVLSLDILEYRVIHHVKISELYLKRWLSCRWNLYSWSPCRFDIRKSFVILTQGQFRSSCCFNTVEPVGEDIT